MMNRGHPEETGVEVSSAPVAPKVSRNHGRDDDSPNQRDREIIPILPLDNRIVAQVAYIGWSGFDSRSHEHPHDMRLDLGICQFRMEERSGEGFCVTHPPETALCIIRVQIGIGVAVFG